MMKNYLLAIFFISCSAITFAGDKNQSNNKKTLPIVQPTVINAMDTVILDLSQQTLAGNQISFPVSFVSDDTIFALDFSFKYNQNNFIYDTITNVVGNLQSVSYYNTNDSTVRYTSFSLQSIAGGTPIVMVHFTSLLGSLCIPDLNTVQGYLNGDLCTIRVVPCLGFTAVAEHNINLSVNVYPNPAGEFLNIESAENVSVELTDINGKTIISKTAIEGGQKHQLNISNVTNGVYILRTCNQGYTSFQKVAVSH